MLVICEVDVAIAGGSTSAVAAAVAAAEKGAKVFLAAPRLYLGEDLCATLRLKLKDGAAPQTSLAKKIFGGRRSVTPMRVKKILDQELVDAGVDFLFGCYATDVLRDAEGRVCGFAMANRAGEQAVVAKVIIDATDRAWLARRAGARARPWLGGELAFQRIVVVPQGERGSRSVMHDLTLPMPDRSFQAFAEAEQRARDKTYTDGQLRASESLFHVPPDPIVCRRTEAEWPAPAHALVGHFQPLRVEHLYVLSGCADIPRSEAERLLRPAAMTDVAQAVGAAAAEEADARPAPRGVCLRGRLLSGAVGCNVRDALAGSRHTEERPCVPVGDLPVLGEYDVVVVGGGTSGAPAAIAAGRQGARVLVIEYQEGLGGIGTLGLIGKPYCGRPMGFSKEVPFPDKDHSTEHKMEWYRREIRKVKGAIWFGVLGVGAVVEGRRVKGVVVATPEGRGAVMAKIVIDATGNADIAVAAGADSMYGATDDGHIAMQGAGLPCRPLRNDYVNTDYLLVDESDMVDLWRALVGARQTMRAQAYDAGACIQTRERRRIVGEHVLTYLDQIAGRTYPDSIVLSASDYDSHGYPTHPYFALMPHDETSLKANHPAPGGSCFTPYRCLLPRGLDGILVTGLGISMERDAAAMVRMQRDMQNQGYAAGVAAAMAAKRGIGPRAIDIQALQRHLIAMGCLPDDVLHHQDSFPLPAEALRKAVREIVHPDRQRAARALARVLSHRTRALTELRKAYRTAEPGHRLTYARILGFLGAREVLPTLVSALNAVTEWDDKIFQGVMAEYAHLPTPVDSLILALGYTRDPRALPAILNKLETLTAEVTLSHHRAVALALEQLGDPAAAEPLARLLSKPGMRGHAMTQLEPLYDKPPGRRRRIGPLREIVLARALYRCGDYRGLGKKILEEYRQDIRGLFARHARAVLCEDTEGCEAIRQREI